MISVADKEAN